MVSHKRDWRNLSKTCERISHISLSLAIYLLKRATKKAGGSEISRSSTGQTISTFGLSGAGPYHYFRVYDRVRSFDSSVPILIVVYLWNDLVDESILQSVAPRYERYMKVHRAVFSNSKGQPYWPCFDPENTESLAFHPFHFLRRTSLPLSVAQPKWYQIKEAIFSANGKFKFEIQRKTSLPEFVTGRHTRVLVNGRLFFIQLHNYSVDLNVASNMRSLLRIKDQLAERVHDQKLTIALVLDREDVCKKFHNVEIKDGHDLIKQIATVGVRIINPNLAFSQECMQKELFLPDGHWNYDGHQLFAQIIEREWIMD